MGVWFWSIGSISAQEIGKTSVCVLKMLPFHGGSLHPWLCLLSWGWRAFAHCVSFVLSQGLARPPACIDTDNFIRQTFEVITIIIVLLDLIGGDPLLWPRWNLIALHPRFNSKLSEMSVRTQGYRLLKTKIHEIKIVQHERPSKDQ